MKLSEANGPWQRPMQIHVPDPSTLNQPLRARLLGQTLRGHLKRRGHDIRPSVPRQTGVGAVQVTCTRAALPAKPHAPATASLGLGLTEALAQGRATLLLCQSLYAELETLAEADAWAAAGTLPLLLQGYTRAIVLERANMAGSIGFAPWLPLELVDGLPVLASHPVRLSPDSPPRILILDHGAPEGQAEVLRRALSDLGLPLRLITPGSDHASMGAGLVADLHLHLGFGAGRAVTALSPADSLLSGVYTLVLPAAGHGAGQALRALMAGRSYGDLAPSLSELERRARAILTRMAAIRSAGEATNPELARYAARNAADRAAAFKRFDAVFDTTTLEQAA